MKNAFIIFLILLLAGCLGQVPVHTDEKEAVRIAEEFIEKGPTYGWDGMEGSMKASEVVSLSRCPCWGVTLFFQCTHGGYGDRTGKAVTQALTWHKAVVVIEKENGVITSAIIDEVWDELNQREIESTLPPETLKPGDPSKCIFLEFWMEKNGKVLSGEAPRIMIDFPTYTFEKSSGTLEGLINFEINDGLFLIVGMGQNLSGDTGSGASSILYGVYGLPFSAEDLKVTAIGKDGMMEIFFKGERISLGPGGEWTKTETNVEDTGSARIEYTSTYRISNFGWIQKSNIKKNPYSIS